MSANVDVFVQVWYLKNIQPEQMWIKDTAVDDKLQKLHVNIPPEQKQQWEVDS